MSIEEKQKVLRAAAKAYTDYHAGNGLMADLAEAVRTLLPLACEQVHDGRKIAEVATSRVFTLNHGLVPENPVDAAKDGLFQSYMADTYDPDGHGLFGDPQAVDALVEHHVCEYKVPENGIVEVRLYAQSLVMQFKQHCDEINAINAAKRRAP